MSVTILNPTKDAHLTSGTPTVKNGGAAYLSVRRHVLGDLHRGILHFDLSGTNSRMIAVSVVLRLNVTTQTDDTAIDHRIGKVAGDWTEADCNWNTKDGADAWTAELGGGSYVLPDPGFLTFTGPVATGTFDITDTSRELLAAVQAAFGDPNGLTLKIERTDETAGTGEWLFDSRTGTTPPQLIVTRASPTPGDVTLTNSNTYTVTVENNEDTVSVEG